jgi:hypothetical protein
MGCLALCIAPSFRRPFLVTLATFQAELLKTFMDSRFKIAKSIALQSAQLSEQVLALSTHGFLGQRAVVGIQASYPHVELPVTH